MSNTSQALFNPEVEANTLCILLKAGPDIWGEFHLNDRMDWSSAHRPLWDIISLQLNTTPPGSLDPLLLSEKLKGNSVTQLEGGFEIFDYLSGLTNRYVEKERAAEYARELKRLRVRRDLIAEAEATRAKLVGSPNATFEEMTTLVERGLSKVSTEYHKPDITEVMGGDFVHTIEERANNPIKPEDMLYMGPFESINRTVGPAVFPGSLSVLVARTGVGKSSLSFYWCTYVAERYNLPLLWLDAAEMTVEQLRFRAACCFSKGKVPLWAVRSGEWKQRAEWRKIMYEDVFPKAQRLRMSYKNVGGLSPREKITFMRRFYYNTVGRDNFLLIGDDYLKGVEAVGQRSAEWQAMGYYVGDVKTLVTDEIQAGYWTSLQGNRNIVTQGKKEKDIVDSGETGASISDRIIQQATTAWLMRYKVAEELARERNLFGNMVLKRAKIREGYGRDYERIARPIKLPGGGYCENHWNLDSHMFYYADKGLHSEALDVLGQSAVEVPSDVTPRAQPL
jgi:hypothetical protein